MSTQSLSAYQTKIYQLLFGLAIVGLALYAVRTITVGATNKALLLSVGIVGAALIVALDRFYWVLGAFFFGFNDVIPKLKFTGAELGALILIATFYARSALKRDSVVEKRPSVVFAAVPFLIWMMLVWVQNPTGMLIFGSSQIGGRFYFKVILAFLAAFCLSRMKFSNSDCKKLGFAIGFGYLSCTLHDYTHFNSYSLLGEGTHYAYTQLAYIAPLFLCRFTAPELLHRFWPLVGFLLTYGLSVYSGHRSSFARPTLIGLMAPFFMRRDRFKTIVIILVAMFPLTLAVCGQGVLWRLPFAIQRSFSFLPAKWDRRLENYGLKDEFRAALRVYAKEHIRENPWFGDGGFSLNLSSMSWASSSSVNSDQYYGHILARNWHNVWLGMAADFGIPLSVCWAFFLICVLVFGWNGLKFLPPGSWNQTMYLYFYLFIIVEFINGFFNGGHSARTPELFFYWVGFMVAVLNGTPEWQASVKSSKLLS